MGCAIVRISLWRACSRLYRKRFLQVKFRFAAFLKIYKTLHVRTCAKKVHVYHVSRFTRYRTFAPPAATAEHRLLNLAKYVCDISNVFNYFEPRLMFVAQFHVCEIYENGMNFSGGVYHCFAIV